ncbi:GNAT family N-acetyltransferase [Shewanella marisflavi]|uniref:GNAT family N-acetyltransferase n=1 Tax=Shewanella marisflavi TaxID=260364 RepID=UPI00200D1A0A|nr:GNAT family N-acetyltransferase [Shewanella marisflavi]MCL1041858.1 GNAT family N-acetyltransferase [Shewanella marisflavi]
MRPISATDRELYHRLYCNGRVMRHIAPPLTQHRADKAFQIALSQMTQALSDTVPTTQYMNWTIMEQKRQRAIGIQGLTWQGNDRSRAEIGIMLLPEANGKLYPEEAMGALMEYAYLKLKVERIQANFAAKNLATERFVKKLGFVFETAPFSLPKENENYPQKMKSCFAERVHYISMK